MPRSLLIASSARRRTLIADPWTGSASVYLDGNRTRDSFFMLGAGTTACRVSTSPCNDDYTYDPRDRVVKANKGDGTTSSYFNPTGSGKVGLDPTGNITQEQIVSGGVTTTKNYNYSGNQLQQVTTNTVPALYWYNDDGDLWCVTSSAGSKANCPTSLSGACMTCATRARRSC